MDKVRLVGVAAVRLFSMTLSLDASTASLTPLAEDNRGSHQLLFILYQRRGFLRMFPTVNRFNAKTGPKESFERQDGDERRARMAHSLPLPSETSPTTWHLAVAVGRWFSFLDGTIRTNLVVGSILPLFDISESPISV
ncbi:hypothetical protein RU639_008774 [Aspergillus parasiticus]